MSKVWIRCIMAILKGNKIHVHFFLLALHMTVPKAEVAEGANFSRVATCARRNARSTKTTVLGSRTCFFIYFVLFLFVNR